MGDVKAREVADDVVTHGSDREVLPTEPAAEPEVNVDEPVASQTTEEPEGGSDEPSGVSEALIGRAKDYGLSQDDLEGFDEARLERMFSAIDRRIMQPQSQTQPMSAPAPMTTGATPTPMTSEGYTPLKIEFGDDLDESVTKPFTTVVDHLNGQLKDIHAFRQQAVMELQAMNVLREFSEFDRFLTGFGDEWNKDYGSGATVDLDPQSKEFQKRLEVFNGAKSLRSDAARRRQRMSVSDSLTRSHRAVHWDRIAEHERTKLDGKIDRRRKGFGERPVKGKQPAMSPREEAIEAWK